MSTQTELEFVVSAIEELKQAIEQIAYWNTGFDPSYNVDLLWNLEKMLHDRKKQLELLQQ